jgi:hypothetical protein
MPSARDQQPRWDRAIMSMETSRRRFAWRAASNKALPGATDLIDRGTEAVRYAKAAIA